MTYPIRLVPDNDTNWGGDLRATIAGVNDHQTRLVTVESGLTGVQSGSNAQPAPVIYDDFTGADAASWNARWSHTLNAGTADILGNAGRHLTSATASSRVESTITGYTVGDGEVLYKFQWSGVSTNRVEDFRFRAADNTSANCYVVGIGPTSVILNRRVASVSNVQATVSTTLNGDTWYWLRARFVGSDIKARWWAVDAAEPAAWLIDVTDTTYTSGLVTLSTRNNTGAQVTLRDDFRLWNYATSGGGSSGVSSLNTLTGAVTLSAGTNVTITPSGNNLAIAASGSGSGGYATVQDEGAAETQRATLNFIGTGVTVADDSANSRTNVTISGSASAVPRPVSLVVVSTDAPQAWKDAADYVCDGTTDQVEINTAIDRASALQSRNAGSPVSAQQIGKVQLSGGRFNIGGTGIKMRTGVTVEGTGFLTEVRAVSLGTNPMFGLAAPSDHLTKLGHMFINGNSTSGGTGNGVDYDMSGATDTSAYPDLNPDADHYLYDLYLDVFTGGTSTRTAIYLHTSSTGNNRVNFIDRCTIRDCSGHGVWLSSASDSQIAMTHSGGVIAGDGFRIETGNTRLTHCKASYCDGRGFYFASGRGTVTAIEAQDCNIGVFFDGAPYVATGITCDTSQTDGIIVSTSQLQMNAFSIFLRSGARYATQTRGLNIDAAGYTDCQIVGHVNPTSITTGITGSVTAANRNFMRVSPGTGTSIVSVG